MKNSSTSNPKYHLLRKENNFFPYIDQDKKNSIIRLFDKNNFTNAPKLFIGNICDSKNILKIIGSRILISFSDKKFPILWEIASGRPMRLVKIPYNKPQKTFYDCKFGLLIIIMIKNMVVYSTINSITFSSISIDPVFPLNIQWIKKFSAIIIFSKPYNLCIINYKKGYLLRKFDGNYPNIFPNGVISNFNYYFLKNKKSLKVYSISKKSFNNFNLVFKRNLNFRIRYLKEIISNSSSNFLIYSYTVLLFLDKKFYSWDFLTRLLICNGNLNIY